MMSIRTTWVFPIVLFLIAAVGSCPFLSPAANAQISFGGEAAVHALKSEPERSPRSVNNGRATFAWRLDLFVDAIVSEDAAFIANVRAFQNEDPTFDFLAVRIVDVASLGVNLQIGKFDVPFGNLGLSRFPMENVFYGLPLMYEYSTALPSRPIAEADFRNGKGTGPGMRLLDFGMYDVGAMAYGAFGMFGYAVAMTNGTVSNSANRQQSINKDFGKLVRLTLQPIPEITIGAGYNHGAYMTDMPLAAPTTNPNTGGRSVSDYKQQAVEGDIEFSTGHLTLIAQGVYSMYDVPLDTRDIDASVMGFHAEARYTFLTRFTGALRFGSLDFSSVDYGDAAERWDRPVREYEAALRWRADRNIVLKFSYRHTMTKDIDDPADDLAALQLAVAFGNP